MHRHPYRLYGAVALCVLCGASLADAPDRQRTIDDLTWLAGEWHGKLGTSETEEHWIRPAGGTMLGVGRTIAGGKTRFFEFLRIEARDDGLVYIAQPNGGKATEFRLTKQTADEGVFENPEHDFPRLISYRKTAEGSLAVRLVGEEKGKHAEQNYVLRRAP